MNARNQLHPGHLRLATSSLAGLLLVTGGCARTAACLDDGCADDGGTDTGGTDTDDTGGGTGGLPIPVSRDVDILFVIDNSGSMGEEQATLAANVASFIDVLEAQDVQANYRIGITTSDNGNPWCPPGTTTPEAGKLVMSSCKSRIGDFLFNNGEGDVQDLACNDICTLTEAELEILPTTTDYDADAKPRPWLERIQGVKNIPESTDTAAAFACFGPQGINGCGFESQLESMYLALIRAQNSDEESYGFMRPNAVLAVVFVTDEADCSYNKDYAQIFEQDGNKVFWSDPADAFPSSAVCWNAGVECVGDPSSYDSCASANKDVAGNVGVSDSDAVLHPMSRYIGLLDGLEQEKQQYDYENEIIVAVIGGVTANGQAIYADVGDTDPEFQHSFGIGPGCQAPSPLDPDGLTEAVPPVRLLELTEEFTPGNLFSICEQDYSPALQAIAESIQYQLSPACFTKCAQDTDPDTAILDPECTVEEDPPGNDNSFVMQECLRDQSGYVIDPEFDGYAMPSDDVNVCYALLVDPGGQTPDPNDDMSDQCVDDNFHLEFKIARRPGFPAYGGTSVSAICSLADFPEVSCPGIGG